MAGGPWARASGARWPLRVSEGWSFIRRGGGAPAASEAGRLDRVIEIKGAPNGCQELLRVRRDTVQGPGRAVAERRARAAENSPIREPRVPVSRKFSGFSRACRAECRWHIDCPSHSFDEGCVASHIRACHPKRGSAPSPSQLQPAPRTWSGAHFIPALSGGAPRGPRAPSPRRARASPCTSPEARRASPSCAPCPASRRSAPVEGRCCRAGPARCGVP